jgi:hypothetical protein
MKILVFIIITFSSYNLNADDMYYDYCITNSYFKDGYFHVERSDGSTYDYSSFYKYRFDEGYVYNSADSTCTKTQYLGLTPSQYNFLYALIGLIFGYLLFWLVPSSKR